MCKYQCDGCGIYESRPEVCRDFKCIWLRIKEARPNFPERLRPDNVGAMCLTKLPEDNIGQILFDEIAPDSFKILDLNPNQNELVQEIAALADLQDIPTLLFHRTYEWELKKINIQMEQQIT